MSDDQLHPASFYGAALRPHLDREIFQPRPVQLLFFFGYLAVAIACFWTIVHVAPAWPIKLGLSMVFGFCLGMGGFVGHEIMHGSVIRSKFWQHVLGTICLAPYLVSPTFWMFWHNKVHHSKTQAVLQDPDAFPTIKVYRISKFMRFMFPFSPGSGTLLSYGYFFFWFCFNAQVFQLHLRFRSRLFEGLNQRRVTIELIGQYLLWGGILYLGGWENLVWTFAIPFLVQNYNIMSFISTNHNISPLTSVNDPLANSLTVTSHPIIEFLTLNFGYHVEHHIYPTLSSHHMKKVHEVLKREFPHKFQVLTKWQAMKELYRTPRIYKNANTLIHPKTLETFPIRNYLIPELQTPETAQRFVSEMPVTS